MLMSRQSLENEVYNVFAEKVYSMELNSNEDKR